MQNTINGTEHELKCWPRYFEAVTSGKKRFELRIDDRGFQVGDTIKLREWYPANGRYTGESAVFRITYILSLKDYADVKGLRWRLARMLMPNLVILGIDHEKTV